MHDFGCGGKLIAKGRYTTDAGLRPSVHPFPCYRGLYRSNLAWCTNESALPHISTFSSSVPSPPYCTPPNIPWQARDQMLAVAKQAMAAPLIDGNDSTSDIIRGDIQVCNPNIVEDTALGLGMDDNTSMQGCTRTRVFEERVGGCDAEEQVKRSPVMLEFGPETPGHALRVCGKAQQLPFPDGWDDPEVKSRKYSNCCLEKKE